MDIFQRLDRIRRMILILSLFSVFFLAAIFVSLAILREKTPLILTVSLASFALLFNLFLISRLVSSYKQLFGENMMKSVMEARFDDVHYEPARALAASVVENTDMIHMGNRYESGEYRSAVYRDIRFTMADVTLKNVIRQGSRTASAVYFSGTWMIFDFEKTFKTHLQIKEKSFLNAQKPRGEHPDMNRVAVGGDDFCRFFKVYAENEEIARSFLSPALEDAVLTLNYALRGDLMFYFSENRLHIALHGKRARYEPPMLGKLYRDEVEKALLSDFQAVSAFLDRLLEIPSLFENE